MSDKNSSNEARLAQLAQQALDVQDAINLIGLVRRWGEVCRELRELLPHLSTSEFSQHCINRLWASKVHDLCRMGISDMAAYGYAHEECLRLAEMAKKEGA